MSGEKPITSSELETAKANVVQGYPGQFELASPVVDRISRHWAWELPMSEIRSWPDTIASTSLESVNAVARKYARPEKQVFLLIGDRSKIEPALLKMNLGEVVALNYDGSIANDRQ